MQKCRFLAGVLAVGLVSPGAFAATTYSYFYITPVDDYTAAPGASVTVPFYLEEVNSDGSANSLLVSEDGLSEAGVNVSMLSGAAGSMITAAAANTGAVPDGFDDPSSAATVNSASSATITESTDPFPFGADMTGVEPTTQSGGVADVLLGSVTFQASALPGQSTVFTAGVADPNSGSTFTNDNGYDLDDSSDPFNPGDASTLYSSAASTTFTISTTSVPEPLSVLLPLCGALPVWRSRRRPVTPGWD